MKRLELLDWARMVAVLSVIAFHYLYSGISNGKVGTLAHGPLAAFVRYGYLGVEFFFLISGYVICRTARGKTPGEFAAARALRLYPAFWVALACTSVMACFWGGTRMGVTWSQVVANLTMVPALFGQPPVDGAYWTLVLELTFYGAVLLLLAFGQQHRLNHIFLCWPVVMLSAATLGLQDVVLLGGYYSFFAAGAIFAALRDARLSPAATGWAHASLLLAFLLCMDGAFRRAPGLSTDIIATILTLQFAFFFVLNTDRGQSVRLPGSRLAGGLTYPLYLVHAHIGYMLLNRYADESNKAIVYALVIASVSALALFIHLVVENRLAGAWSRFFDASIAQPIDAFLSVRPGRRSPSLRRQE